MLTTGCIADPLSQDRYPQSSCIYAGSRLLYGPYKAAGPGGWNMDPQAFSPPTAKDGGSRLPSQARVQPTSQVFWLTEQQFQPVITAAYFSARDFHFELTHGEVSTLTHLYKQEADAVAASHQAGARAHARESVVVGGQMLPTATLANGVPARWAPRLSAHEHSQMPEAGVKPPHQAAQRKEVVQPVTHQASHQNGHGVASNDAAELSDDVVLIETRPAPKPKAKPKPASLKGSHGVPKGDAEVKQRRKAERAARRLARAAKAEKSAAAASQSAPANLPEPSHVPSTSVSASAVSLAEAAEAAPAAAAAAASQASAAAAEAVKEGKSKRKKGASMPRMSLASTLDEIFAQAADEAPSRAPTPLSIPTSNGMSHQSAALPGLQAPIDGPPLQPKDTPQASAPPLALQVSPHSDTAANDMDGGLGLRIQALIARSAAAQIRQADDRHAQPPLSAGSSPPPNGPIAHGPMLDEAPLPPHQPSAPLPAARQGSPSVVGPSLSTLDPWLPLP